MAITHATYDFRGLIAVVTGGLNGIGAAIADAYRRSGDLTPVKSAMRNAYGDEHGLVVETAPGAGTKVTVRVPKFAPGVQV